MVILNLSPIRMEKGQKERSFEKGRSKESDSGEESRS